MYIHFFLSLSPQLGYSSFFFSFFSNGMLSVGFSLRWIWEEGREGGIAISVGKCFGLGFLSLSLYIFTAYRLCSSLLEAVR